MASRLLIAVLCFATATLVGTQTRIPCINLNTMKHGYTKDIFECNINIREIGATTLLSLQQYAGRHRMHVTRPLPSLPRPAHLQDHSECR